MGRMGKSCRKSGEEIHDKSHTWRVIDDFSCPHPIDPAELDAVEAFLMPLVNALLADGSGTQPGKTNPNMPMPTHKRRNELLPEEI
jgi:hypothetical protein